MSLQKERELREIAKIRCRDLRKRQTNAEKILWERVRNRKLDDKKFYRQYPLFFDFLGKETFYIADFYNHESRIVIELDGKIHEYKKEQDSLRTEMISMLGISVIRFKNEEVENNFEKVIQTIRENLK